MRTPPACRLVFLPTLVLALVAACDDSATPPATGLDASADAPAQPGDGAQSTLSDSQIIGLLIAYDEGEIAEGDLAQRQGADPRVRNFGATMVSMHTASNARLVDLRMRLGLKPEVSALGAMLTADIETTRAMLAPLMGAAFDHAYAASQVRQHGRVLDVINTALVPAAMSPELRAALTNDAAVMMASHLEQARTLQTALDTP